MTTSDPSSAGAGKLEASTPIELHRITLDQLREKIQDVFIQIADLSCYIEEITNQGFVIGTYLDATKRKAGVLDDCVQPFHAIRGEAIEETKLKLVAHTMELLNESFQTQTILNIEAGDEDTRC